MKTFLKIFRFCAQIITAVIILVFVNLWLDEREKEYEEATANEEVQTLKKEDVIGSLYSYIYTDYEEESSDGEDIYMFYSREVEVLNVMNYSDSFKTTIVNCKSIKNKVEVTKKVDRIIDSYITMLPPLEDFTYEEVEEAKEWYKYEVSELVKAHFMDC